MSRLTNYLNGLRTNFEGRYTDDQVNVLLELEPLFDWVTTIDVSGSYKALHSIGGTDEYGREEQLSERKWSDIEVKAYNESDEVELTKEEVNELESFFFELG